MSGWWAAPGYEEDWSDGGGKSWGGTSPGGGSGAKRSWSSSGFPESEGPPAKMRRGSQSWQSSWDSAGSWDSPSHASASSGWSSGAWDYDAIRAGDRADIEQWQGCTPLGSCVRGTRIVPCKTPFEGELANRAHAKGLIQDDDWFGKKELIELCEAQSTPIGLVIDMVNTEKYYSGFTQADGIEYRKVRIPGRTIPERTVIEEVFDLIDDFLSRRPGEYVAVHCTHGINRTGFLVAAYLMTRAKVPGCQKAVARFEKARGHKMDKEYLLEALMWLEEGTY
mmetsp:Transcript_108515/g.231734  ORF Transcript_108515/g.231734 Transcript_108515/m.231734 type:complete len:280 (+) Transcript_108515:68-907(+)